MKMHHLEIVIFEGPRDIHFLIAFFLSGLCLFAAASCGLVLLNWWFKRGIGQNCINSRGGEA